MAHLRLLRVLLAGLLVLLGALVVWGVKPRNAVHTVAVGGADRQGADVAQIQVWQGDEKKTTGVFETVDTDQDGGVRFKGAKDLVITRPNGEPLRIDSASGSREGRAGEYEWAFEDGVTLWDPVKRMRLTLPFLDVDESAEEARSAGTIRFEAPAMSGTAERLVYSLADRPGRLTSPELNQDDGGRLVADEAVLLDGLDDIELIGHVQVDRSEGHLEARRIRIRRDDAGRLRSAAASGDVNALAGGQLGGLDGESLDLHWDAEGNVENFLLEGQAVVRRGVESLAADRIEAVRRAGAAGAWDVRAGDAVYVQGLFEAAPGLLRAERLEAVLSSTFALSRGEVSGRVSFEGARTRAEAERAVFEADPNGGSVTLFAGERRKARLADGQSRVAAATIRTSPGGEWLDAEGSVEATVLAGAPDAGRRQGLFRPDQAIHFVAAHLSSRRQGRQLELSGMVRGWQGQRNLAAERVVLDQDRHTLEARGSVCVRLPRLADGLAVGEADYVQICGDALDYDEQARTADFRGNARMTLAEGWLESRDLHVLLTSADGSIELVRAVGNAELECHETGGEKMTGPIHGTADVVIYLPDQHLVRLIGEQTPAAVRRVSPGGGTTTGRVLRYRLDQGTLEVDSSGGGPARISTGDG